MIGPIYALVMLGVLIWAIKVRRKFDEKKKSQHGQ